MVTIEEWFTTLPPLTRFWLMSAVVTGLLAALGVPVYPYLTLNWNAVLGSLQVCYRSIARSLKTVRAHSPAT